MVQPFPRVDNVQTIYNLHYMDIIRIFYSKVTIGNCQTQKIDTILQVFLSILGPYGPILPAIL